MMFDYDPENLFAKILRGDIPNKTAYESDTVLAFHDIAPQAPIHILIIPKGPYASLDHFSKAASPEEKLGFFTAISDICESFDVAEGFRAISNTRAYGGQEVPHYHMHLLAGRPLGQMIPERTDQ